MTSRAEAGSQATEVRRKSAPDATVIVLRRAGPPPFGEPVGAGPDDVGAADAGGLPLGDGEGDGRALLGSEVGEERSGLGVGVAVVEGVGRRAGPPEWVGAVLGVCGYLVRTRVRPWSTTMARGPVSSLPQTRPLRTKTPSLVPAPPSASRTVSRTRPESVSTTSTSPDVLSGTYTSRPAATGRPR